MPLRKPSRHTTAPIFTFWNWLLNMCMYVLLIVLMMNAGEFRLLSQLIGGLSIFERPWLLLTAVVSILFISGTVPELGHLVAGKLVHLHLQLLKKLSGGTAASGFGIGGFTKGTIYRGGGGGSGLVSGYLAACTKPLETKRPCVSKAFCGKRKKRGNKRIRRILSCPRGVTRHF